jgi:Ion channel.
MSKIYRNYMIHPLVGFKSKQILTISAILLLAGFLMRINLHSVWWNPGKRFIAPSLLLVILTFILASLIKALVQRLLDVVKYNQPSQARDLLLIGFSYVSTVVIFGIFLLGSQTLLNKNVFKVMGRPGEIGIVDALYLSGITIATIGYGDITPIHWLAKFLVVIESMLGLGITAIVAGLFIGSLLSRVQQERQTRWFAGLRRVYFKALEEVKVAISEVKDWNEERYTQLQKELLKTIATLVSTQYAPPPSATVTVNWMQLYSGDKAPERYLSLARDFTHPIMRDERSMRTLWGILIMRQWSDKPAYMPDNDEFALPVYDPENPNQHKFQLPGAPQAIGSSEGYIVVSNSKNIDLSNQDESVRQKLIEYFQSHAPELRSFASLRLEYNGKALGVINIQSSEVESFGATLEEQRLLVDMLEPFARYLADVIVERAKTLTPEEEK